MSKTGASAAFRREMSRLVKEGMARANCGPKISARLKAYFADPSVRVAHGERIAAGMERKRLQREEEMRAALEAEIRADYEKKYVCKR